jgi:hypothetical protein
MMLCFAGDFCAFLQASTTTSLYSNICKSLDCCSSSVTLPYDVTHSDRY